MDNPQPNKGGRPLGAVSKLARDAREAAKATGLLPHEILLSMARGEPQIQYLYDNSTGKVVEQYVSLDIEQRKDAAKAAAPYYAPKISTVEIIRGVEDAELDTVIKELAAQTGISLSPGGEEPEDEAPASPPSSRRSRILE